MTARRVPAFAIAYWGGIFALGFVLGTLRVLWLAPLLGETAAVLAELPVMLTASWMWARRLLARRPLASTAEALAAGGLAFVMLLGAELVLGMLALGQSPGEWAAARLRPAGTLGLAGQIAFALFPALAARR